MTQDHTSPDDSNFAWATRPSNKTDDQDEYAGEGKTIEPRYLPDESPEAHQAIEGKDSNGEETTPFFNPEKNYNRWIHEGPFFDSYNDATVPWHDESWLSEDTKRRDELMEGWESRQKEVDAVANSYLWDKGEGNDKDKD